MVFIYNLYELYLVLNYITFFMLIKSGQCVATGSSVGSINEFNEIEFFRDNNIKIKKICGNTCALTLFWITKSGQVMQMVEMDIVRWVFLGQTMLNRIINLHLY